jgi:hypothetical protein
MDEWFFLQQDPPGWHGYPDQIDRRCYPNSSGRVVHIWGSQIQGGEPRIVAGQRDKRPSGFLLIVDG